MCPFFCNSNHEFEKLKSHSNLIPIFEDGSQRVWEISSAGKLSFAIPVSRENPNLLSEAPICIKHPFPVTNVAVNSFAVHSVSTVNSVSVFWPRKKTELLTVTWASKKIKRKTGLFTFISFSIQSQISRGRFTKISDNIFLIWVIFRQSREIFAHFYL